MFGCLGSVVHPYPQPHEITSLTSTTQFWNKTAMLPWLGSFRNGRTMPLQISGMHRSNASIDVCTIQSALVRLPRNVARGVDSFLCINGFLNGRGRSSG